jgi:hypothetical protein
MLTHRRLPVCLSLISYDLPLWSVLETSAALYQKNDEQFHVLLTEPLVQDPSFPEDREGGNVAAPSRTPRLVWLEISPYRVTMTMQGNGNLSYRHFWEEGVYGLSRYWLQSHGLSSGEHMRLRNFTRQLNLTQEDSLQTLRIEYELWAQTVQLGHYVLNLEIHH